MEEFMDDLSFVGDTFEECFKHLRQSYKDVWRQIWSIIGKNGHKVYQKGMEDDKAMIEVIEKLAPPISVKGVCSFLGHAGQCWRFIKDFSKIPHPLCRLLEKEVKFNFDGTCMIYLK